MDEPNYRDWLGHELTKSEPWQAHVDARRAEAMKPRRTASGCSIASYSSLEGIRLAQEGWSQASWLQRPFAWSDDRVASYSFNPAPYEALEHLRRYELNLETDEKSWIGATAAPELHSFYCSPSGYLPNLPSVLALYSAPVGGQASLAAAKITGVDFGSSSARRQAFYRTSPRHPSSEPFIPRERRFTAYLKPGDVRKGPASSSRNSQNPGITHQSH
jgi:hypothetical protein